MGCGYESGTRRRTALAARRRGFFSGQRPRGAVSDLVSEPLACKRAVRMIGIDCWQATDRPPRWSSKTAEELGNGRRPSQL